MTDKQQDTLIENLSKLQEELDSFGKVRDVLKDANEHLTNAMQEWDKLTKEQQQTTLELAEATKGAITGLNSATSKTELLIDILHPLAKAIHDVNFPGRLDKIDMAVSTQTLTMVSFQEVTGRSFTVLQSKMEKGRKRDRIITILLSINIAFLTGSAALFYFGFVSSFGK
jgi:hypothetical protein